VFALRISTDLTRLCATAGHNNDDELNITVGVFRLSFHIYRCTGPFMLSVEFSQGVVDSLK